MLNVHWVQDKTFFWNISPYSGIGQSVLSFLMSNSEHPGTTTTSCNKNFNHPFISWGGCCNLSWYISHCTMQTIGLSAWPMSSWSGMGVQNQCFDLIFGMIQWSWLHYLLRWFLMKISWYQYLVNLQMNSLLESLTSLTQTWGNSQMIPLKRQCTDVTMWKQQHALEQTHHIKMSVTVFMKPTNKYRKQWLAHNNHTI